MHKGSVLRVENTKTKKPSQREIYFFNDAILITKLHGNFQSGAYTLKYKAFLLPGFLLEINETSEGKLV